MHSSCLHVVVTCVLLPLHATHTGAAAPAPAAAATKSDAGVTIAANPTDPFLFALGQNAYRTKNYFIGAYHYVQCFGTDMVVPATTAEAAQAVAHYHKRALVGFMG